jgi:PilZ domain
MSPNLIAISRRRIYTPGMFKERRQASRYSAHLKGSLSLPAQNTTLAVVVEDLCVLGCLLEYAASLQVHQECELTVEWKGREFRTPAVVAWYSPQGQAGLSFQNTEPASQQLLREICAELR